MDDQKKGLKYKPASTRYLVYALASLGLFVLLGVIDNFMFAGNIKWFGNGLIAVVILCVNILIVDKKEQEKLMQEKWSDK